MYYALSAFSATIYTTAITSRNGNSREVLSSTRWTSR